MVARETNGRLGIRLGPVSILGRSDRETSASTSSASAGTLNASSTAKGQWRCGWQKDGPTATSKATGRAQTCTSCTRR